MFGDRVDHARVGGRVKRQFASGRLLRLEIGDKLLVERQGRRVEGGRLGDLLLEGGLAPPEPEEQPQGLQRPPAQELQQPLVQGVGMQQGTVKIDAQGKAGGRRDPFDDGRRRSRGDQRVWHAVSMTSFILREASVRWGPASHATRDAYYRLRHDGDVGVPHARTNNAFTGPVHRQGSRIS